MSLPLIDARLKITPDTDAVLEALHLADGKDRAEIMREVLADWAEKKIHEASLIDSRLRREGLRGIAGGIGGNAREDEGSAGIGRSGGRASA